MSATEYPINPIQAAINGMSAAWRDERSKTQMTLGGLIAALEALPPERKVVGIGNPMSYRGYYSDLAFSPVAGWSTDRRTPEEANKPAETTVGELLATARACMGEVFEGYKGGDFVMGKTTPLWIAGYSHCGPRLMGLNTDADPITPITAEEEL